MSCCFTWELELNQRDWPQREALKSFTDKTSVCESDFTELPMEKMWRQERLKLFSRFNIIKEPSGCEHLECPAYLWVVLHDTADPLHYVNAALSVQAVDQLGQISVAVPDGPVLQSCICPFVIWRVAIGEGCHLALRSISQRLIDVDPLGTHMGCHHLQDVDPWGATQGLENLMNLLLSKKVHWVPLLVTADPYSHTIDY